MKTITITKRLRPVDPAFAEVSIDVAGDDRSFEASTRPRRDGTPLSLSYVVGWTDKSVDPTAQERIEAACAATLRDGITRRVEFGPRDEGGRADGLYARLPGPIDRDRAYDDLCNEGHADGYNPGLRG